jgi:hypothetical protein
LLGGALLGVEGSEYFGDEVGRQLKDGFIGVLLLLKNIVVAVNEKNKVLLVDNSHFLIGKWLRLLDIEFLLEKFDFVLSKIGVSAQLLDTLPRVTPLLVE